MRVLVCGGRDFATTDMDQRDFVYRTLCELHSSRGPFAVVIHGCATGADEEAMSWAQMMPGVLHAPYRAEWRRLGKGAGPIRNQRMLDQGKPDLVIAFPGNRGTADMTRRAKAAGIEVLEVAP